MASNLSAPIKVGINITNECNLRCIHCLADSSNKLENEVTTPEIYSFFDELSELKVCGVLISGGEPFMHPDFFEIVQYALDRNLTVSFSTNGTYLTKEVVKKLNNTNIKHIQVSLNAPTPNLHNSLAKSNIAYARTVRGIKNLVETGLDTQIATVVSEINYKTIPELLDLAIRLGVNSHRSMVLMPAGRGYNLRDKMLSREKIVNMVEYLNKRKADLADKLDVQFDHPFIPPEDFKTEDEMTENELYFSGCQAGKTEARVLANGDIVPCHLISNPEYVVGNIRQDSFKEVWDNSEILDVFRNIKAADKKGTCPSCDIGYACKGGCHAVSYNLCGDILNQDPRCPF